MADFNLNNYSPYYTPEHSPIKVEMDERNILSSCAYTQSPSMPCQPMSVIRDPVFDTGKYLTVTCLFAAHMHTRSPVNLLILLLSAQASRL